MYICVYLLVKTKSLKMRKHRNANQDKIFLKFMTAHPGLARGFCRDDKLNQEEKWKELAYLLNDAGPPTKEVSGWKKTWIDWKITIRKKLYRKMNIDRTSDGETDDKYELSKIERSINFICDLDNQQGRRDEVGEFICDVSNPLQSPIASPKLESQATKKRKHEGLRESFLEALTQNSSENFNYDVEIKVEKEDDTEQLAYQTTSHHQALDQSSNLTTTSAAKKRKNDIRIKHYFETMAESSRGIRDETTKGIVDSFQNKLYSIGQKLDELGGKYDKLIELKKEQIEEMRKDREERRRHNLEIEFFNRTLLTLKTKKELG